MSNSFLERRRPAGLYALTCVVALVVLAAVGVAVASGLGQQGRPGRGVPPTGAARGGGSGPALVVGGPVRLVAGSRVVAGVHVGFPRSGAGAVSAAVEYWTQIASTLDPARAAALGRLLADRSWPNAAADLAQGPVNTRRRLGLPASGPVPAGTSVALAPASYQVRDASAAQITVLLLADYIVTVPQAGPDTRTGVFPMLLRWSAADWKICDPGPDPDYSGLVAEPGSAQAAAVGWQMFTR